MSHLREHPDPLLCYIIAVISNCSLFFKLIRQQNVALHVVQKQSISSLPDVPISENVPVNFTSDCFKVPDCPMLSNFHTFKCSDRGKNCMYKPKCITAVL